MEDIEINKILEPKKRLVILFIIFLSIAILCIGVVFFMKPSNKDEELLDLSELVANNSIEKNQYVKLESNSLPIMLTGNYNEDNHYYYINDINNNIYIVNLSNETFKSITELINRETGKLNSSYEIKGVINNIDEQIKGLALTNSFKIFKTNEVNSNNFSKYFGDFYIKENITSQRSVTLYNVLALTALFFLIVAFGYILPGILKVRKNLNNKELMDDLRVELRSLLDTPYKKYHLYLTRNYIVSGIQAIKYEDIIGAYISTETSHGINVGKNLNVCTKDGKTNIIASVTTKNDIINTIIEDLHTRNEDIIIGYNDKDKEKIIEKMKKL